MYNINNLKILLIIFLLIFSLSIVACNNSTNSQEVISLQRDLKEFIISKNSNYDFLKDKSYITKVYNLIEVTDRNVKKEHIEIGDLDGDNIPEIVIFSERDPSNQEDEGYISVLKFNGHSYEVIDKVGMNYDNTNYEMKIGLIGENQPGLYINNQIGAHSGLTYGFILKNNKLFKILDNKKINLLSVYPNNKIKDINNDGILEFSVYTIDPENDNNSTSESDKVLFWYQWNGKDSGDLVHIEKFPNNKNSKYDIEEEKDKISKDISNINLDNIDTNSDFFIEKFTNNIEHFSKEENTFLLEKYFQYLNLLVEDKNNEINSLIEKYNIYITDETINMFNSLEEIDENNYFKHKLDLKKLLIKNKNLGLHLRKNNDKLEYEIDYSWFSEEYSQHILNEYNEYLNILSSIIPINKNNESVYMRSLAEKIVTIEHFKNFYPYSKYIDKINDIYNDSINLLLWGSDINPHFIGKDSTIKKNILVEYKHISNKYEGTHLSNLLNELLLLLDFNNYNLNSNILNNINAII